MNWGRRRIGPLAGLFSLVLTGIALPVPSASSNVIEGRTIAVPRAAPGSSVPLRLPIEANMVGFNWSGRQDGVVHVRALTTSGWSQWFEADGQPDEGPDRSSPEYKPRTASNPVWLGRGVRDIEVRSDDLPGLRLHAIHADLGSRAPAVSSAAADVAQPAIISRASWGADESWRNCGPNYSDRARYAVVHHTVNGNSYTPDEAAAVIRSIYHYHTKGNGWCDIGYNFLIDRYGRVYEGRYGGIARPVLGAHAGGFNSQSTGIALLGTDSLSGEARSALVNLLAWKLDWHQIDPTGQIQVTSNGSNRYPAGTVVTLNTIIGHRDVVLTACPGDTVYGQLPQIRNDAAAEITSNPPKVKINQSDGATNVAEGRKTDSYTITLGIAAPSAPVTIAIHPDSQVTVSPNQLSFTPLNWSTPQTVVVSAVDDTQVESSSHFGMITHTSSSIDSNFNVLPIRYVEPLITDNEAILGGVLTSGPDVSSWGRGRLDVFARGADNALYHKWYSGGWSGWESQGGVITSDPSAVSWGSGRIDVFARGTDNALWHKWFNGSWSGWESLGGVLTSGPDAAAWGPGRLDIFVRGTDNALWHRSWDGSRWSGWESLGGVLASDPAVAAWGPGRLDVFVRGTDNGLWHRYFANGRWSGWEPLGGTLSSSPDVSSWGAGRLDVFTQGDDATLAHLWFDGVRWSAWERLGGALTSDPGAVSWASGRIDVFARTTGDALWHKWWDGTRWRQEL